MPGIKLAYTINGRPPIFLEELVGKSLNIYAGDALALSAYSGVAPNSGVASVRTLLAADKSADYGGAVVSAPSAPTITTATTGGNIPNSSNQTFYAVITLVSATGETTASAVSNQVTMGAGSANSISCVPPTAATNAVGWKLYLGAGNGPNTGPFYEATGTLGFGQTATITAAPSTSAPQPPATNTTGQIAGVLGVAQWSGQTNANGQWSGYLSPGGIQPGSVNYQFPTMGSGIPQDPNTNQSRITAYACAQQNVFVCKLDSTSANATPALNNTLGGLILTGTNPTAFTVDTNASAGQQILRILRCDESDPLYGSAQGRVFFQFLESYDQGFLGRSYTAQ